MADGYGGNASDWAITELAGSASIWVNGTHTACEWRRGAGGVAAGRTGLTGTHPACEEREGAGEPILGIMMLWRLDQSLCLEPTF